ncbi:uncharacterized protein LOC132061499 [Lycium ferocissimum]|uniref:uncharacterized protein LOC132061499 n=1 Tax=Lycium ferocissimum TaxID=112874 RepID=UPI002814E731|nr:uncharacterized protein LOC132061499 [Lycium ferocissimum]
MGEVLMTDGGRFSLPGDNKSMNQKRKRKRKRRPDWEVKQKKPRKKPKEEEKRVQHDVVEVVKEQKKLDEQQNEQLKFSVSRVEKTADMSNLCPQEIVENEQPGVNLPQILSLAAPPGFEFRAEEDATANKAHNSSSSSERPAEDQVPIMDDLSDALEESKKSPKQQRHTGDESVLSETVLSLNQNEQQSVDTERLEVESVAEDLLKTKKQQKEHRGGQQTNRPTRTLTRTQRKGTVTPKHQWRAHQNPSSRPFQEKGQELS